jgi:SAM-dependent methyltransferase
MAGPVTSRYRSHERLRAYMEQRWANADPTPWKDIRIDPIENAKAGLLKPHLIGVRSVIDLGCGGGDFLSLLVPPVAIERAVGVDCASGAIARARSSGLYTDLHQAPIAEVPESVRGPFDLVLVCEVLYYEADPRRTLQTILDRFVGSGSRLVLTLAVGRDYFWPGDVASVNRLLRSRNLVPVLDHSIDYTVRGIPKRRFGPVFPQTRKSVMVWRRP